LREHYVAREIKMMRKSDKSKEIYVREKIGSNHLSPELA